MKQKLIIGYRVIAYILLLNLFLQSCTNFDQLSPQNDVSTPVKQRDIKQVDQVLQKGLRKKGWEEVSCYQVGDGLRVKGVERHGNLSKEHDLPVYINSDVDLEQERLVHIKDAKYGQPGHIAIFKGALLGGMKKQKVPENGKKSSSKVDASKKKKRIDAKPKPAVVKGREKSEKSEYISLPFTHTGQPTDNTNKKLNYPFYLINTIAYVDCPKEFGYDSSDEDISGDFEEKMFDFDINNIENFPFKTSKIVKPKIHIEIAPRNNLSNKNFHLSIKYQGRKKELTKEELNKIQLRYIVEGEGNLSNVILKKGQIDIKGALLGNLLNSSLGKEGKSIDLEIHTANADSLTIHLFLEGTQNIDRVPIKWEKGSAEEQQGKVALLPNIEIDLAQRENIYDKEGKFFTLHIINKGDKLEKNDLNRIMFKYSVKGKDDIAGVKLFRITETKKRSKRKKEEELDGTTLLDTPLGELVDALEKDSQKSIKLVIFIPGKVAAYKIVISIFLEGTQNTCLVPIKWKKREKKEEAKESIAELGVVLKGDIKSTIGTHHIQTRSKLIHPFLKKLAATAFIETNFSQLERVAVSFALNRPRSLSTRKNKCLYTELAAPVIPDIKNEWTYIESDFSPLLIKYRKFGVFWNYPWYDLEGKPVPYVVVKNFYKQLKRYDKEHGTTKAKIFRDTNERKVQVPYQELRDRLRKHPNTQKLVKEFRDKDKETAIYFSFIDLDVISFNNIYSSYDKIYLDTEREPIVMTTGYDYADKPIDLIGNFDEEFKTMVPALNFANQLDRITRIATARILPLGIYYPEPNLCVLLPPGEPTIPESFVSDNPGRKQGGKLESVILLENIINKRPDIKSDAFIFSNKNAIIINIPSRVAKVKSGRKKKDGSKSYIEFSEDFKRGRYNKLQIEDINNAIRIAQSHANSRDWAENLYRDKKVGNLKGKGVIAKFRSCIGKIFEQNNPLYCSGLEEMKERIEAILSGDFTKDIFDDNGLGFTKETKEIIIQAIQEVHKDVAKFLKEKVFNESIGNRTSFQNLFDKEIGSSSKNDSELITEDATEAVKTIAVNDSILDSPVNITHLEEIEETKDDNIASDSEEDIPLEELKKIS